MAITTGTATLTHKDGKQSSVEVSEAGGAVLLRVTPAGDDRVKHIVGKGAECIINADEIRIVPLH